MVKLLKQLVIVCVWMQMMGSLLAASIRNPSDIHDIIDLDQDYLTYHPYHFSDDVKTAQYNFRLDKGDNFVALRRNHHVDLNVPMCYMDNGEVVCELGTEKDVHFYHDDARSVAVAISNENGTMKMKGIINTNNHTVDIDPLESTDLPSNRYHVIKKRWTANVVQQKVPSYQSPYKPIPKQKRPKPKASSYCIDILCVVDYSIYKKFLQSEKNPAATMKKLRYYYAHVINGVNMRYSSITSKKLEINVRLAGFFIAKRPRDLPFIDASKMQKDSRYRVDSNYTLTSLDTFLKKIQKKESRRRAASILPDFNHASLFLEYASTNLGGSVLDDPLDEDLDKPAYEQADQHKPAKDGVSGDKGGTSYVGGICSRSKSTSLVVDHGAYTSAGIATHELGHNLGVFYHDGEATARSSTCNASFNYIMAPASYLIDKSNLKYSFTFSPCSVKQIKSNLKQLVKINRNCLQCAARDRSSVADEQIDREFFLNLEKLPGQVDDVHAQCQQLYGKGSFMCPPNSPQEMCYRMYCYDPRRGACAIISEQMAASGTPCGKYKICHMGKCINDATRGIDTLDDCPYPDIPSNGAHCEDANPYMCKKLKFRQKCCRSCSQKFTPENSCKDVHIRINNMTCNNLMISVFGQPGCTSDYDVKNICCISCKRLLKTSGAAVMIRIGIGSQNGPVAPPSRNSARSGKNQYLANKNALPDKSSRSKSKSNKSPPKSKNPPSQSGGAPPKGGCADIPNMTVNKKTCTALIAENCNYCRSDSVLQACCGSCQPYVSKQKNCPPPKMGK